MIFMLAGTSDARELAVAIKNRGYRVLASVVTESAAKRLNEAGLEVHVGRLTAEQMVDVIKRHGCRVVVDGSHPYADQASQNAVQAAQEANIPYIRYERENQVFEHPHIIWVDDYEQAAEAAAQQKGVIMLTTGSKTVDIFARRLLGIPEVTLVVRLLPRKENMERCEQLGIEQRHIVAMQGPFSKALNQALYDHYSVDVMVTKESGKVGAVDEKVEAALEKGIKVIMIKRPKVDYGVCYHTYDEVLHHLQQWSSCLLGCNFIR
ncbi:precorrin-6A/cobalt-precorrin-6A reductase [Caldalkalibacillus uzonensis]|uniref:Precorrin-6A/cobalt-precorrin-6A reductase n=1 Tax=Caldalkalibacillus uzonensis TaxID=353224 RepID=A0ABU0CPP5_9BACI|nr:precorrin-6A reductase [Caldalkalibacillus uzonensis]MDQ0338392.1 precorrin-6A/cobalt-precorrin-6A reductase [Caldalkalibacillus uzonensis]